MKTFVHIASIVMALAAMLPACDEDVLLGRPVPTPAPPSLIGPKDGGETPDAGPRNPCETLLCGDPCNPPGTGIQTDFRCNGRGECTTELPLSCDGG